MPRNFSMGRDGVPKRGAGPVEISFWLVKKGTWTGSKERTGTAGKRGAGEGKKWPSRMSLSGPRPRRPPAPGPLYLLRPLDLRAGREKAARIAHVP